MIATVDSSRNGQSGVEINKLDQQQQLQQQQKPHFDAVHHELTILEREIHDVVSTDVSTFQYRQRIFVRFLADWFHPKYQIEEMLQLEFWKDVICEGIALALIVFGVILLLNTTNEVRRVMPSCRW